MQRKLCLGFVSIAALYLSACSEGDPDPRRFRRTDVTGAAGSTASVAAAGSGGTPATGAAGAGGTASGGSNAGGAAGSGSAVPVSFPPPGCTGCLEMDVVIDPAFHDTAVDGSPQYLSTLYNFVFPSTGLDMSNATVTWSVSTLTPGDQVYVTPFAQSGAPAYAGVFRPQTVLSTANGFNTSGTPFVDIVLDLANTAPAGVAATPAPADGGDAGPVLLDNGMMDKSAVYQMGIQVGALATLTEPTTIRLLVDKVTITGVDPSNAMLRTREFTMGAEDLVQNTYRVPAGSTPPKPY